MSPPPPAGFLNRKAIRRPAFCSSRHKGTVAKRLLADAWNTPAGRGSRQGGSARGPFIWPARFLFQEATKQNPRCSRAAAFLVFALEAFFILPVTPQPFCLDSRGGPRRLPHTVFLLPFLDPGACLPRGVLHVLQIRSAVAVPGLPLA